MSLKINLRKRFIILAILSLISVASVVLWVYVRPTRLVVDDIYVDDTVEQEFTLFKYIGTVTFILSLVAQLVLGFMTLVAIDENTRRPKLVKAIGVIAMLSGLVFVNFFLCVTALIVCRHDFREDKMLRKSMGKHGTMALNEKK